ncbi:hypothetical protein [Synechococcus sp. M16CYN]|uniref:hypothetical protein n=1 Tax=Synechococcus sp. M16CYN TaxID=3103139 RepID=UPI0033427E7A
MQLRRPPAIPLLLLVVAYSVLSPYAWRQRLEAHLVAAVILMKQPAGDRVYARCFPARLPALWPRTSL